MTGAPSETYRKEIDGLRAIAVLGVILYHAGVDWCPGGYVGVDVFFVISGYLICSVIVREQDAGRFSIAHFYERRIRRIFPALFLTVAVTFLLSMVILLPTGRADFGAAMAAVSVFASNIYFQRATTYFAVPTLEVPLIHTWSLAVEEQFYVLFPVVLLILWRFGRRVTRAVFVLGLLMSLALSQWAASRHPVAAFYLLPTRAFELLIGILIAPSGSARPSPRVNRALGALAIAGLGMIGYAIVFFSDTTEFPGIHALLPTVGAGLVILGSTPDNVAGRVLGAGPLVFIGLVSYSLYLFHLPLFAFARLISVETPAPEAFVVLTVAALALAALSWRFVEQPCRRRGFMRQGQVFACAAAGTLVMLGTGVAYGYHGIDWWFPNRAVVQTVMAATTSINPRRYECNIERGVWMPPDASCVFGAKVEPTWAVWGDSHADAIMDGIGRIGERRGFSARELTYWGCPPMAVAFADARKGDGTCADYNDAVLQYLLGADAISHVVMAARWTDYVDGPARGSGPRTRGGVNELDELFSLAAPLSDAQRGDVLQKGISDAVTRLIRAGKTVYLFYPVPEYGYDVPRAMSIYARTGRDYEHLTLPYASYKERNAVMTGVLDSLPDSPQLVRIHPEQVLCDTSQPGACVTYREGKILYHDANHLSLEGADLVLGQLVQHLDAVR